MARGSLAGPAGMGAGTIGGLAGHLRDIVHLPRERALARIGYDLKRPVFALPFYRFSLPGLSATTLAATPTDPWPGDADAGAGIVRGIFDLAGHGMRDPAPLWAPAGAAPAWLAALHGFDWLRDLRAAGGDNARRRARALVDDWRDAHATWSALAWDPLVTGRRLANWLGCYEFFAASAEIEFRHRLLASIAHQAQHLYRTLPAGLGGADLVAAAKGLIYAGAAVPGGAAWRARGLDILLGDLPRQILPDGGHAERSPARHMAVLRDLIDIRAALHRTDARDVPPDAGAELRTAIEAMAPVLRMFQHGDGGLGLFNGSTEEEGWRVDLVLQRTGGPRHAPDEAPDCGFQRLGAGRTVVLVDAGAAPRRGQDECHHAGALSLEVSIGRERLIVNCGARAGDQGWWRAQRSTAAHSTLVLGDTNSARLLPGGLGRGARIVDCRREEEEGQVWLDMAHDGYRRRFAMIHRRRLFLSADGTDLRGEDRLEPRGGRRRATAFAVRFHLHPAVRASLARGGDRVLLRLPKGGGWQLRASGAALSLEPSVYLGGGEIRRTQQVVLSGKAGADGAHVKWALRRLDDKPG